MGYSVYTQGVVAVTHSFVVSTKLLPMPAPSRAGNKSMNGWLWLKSGIASKAAALPTLSTDSNDCRAARHKGAAVIENNVRHSRVG